jgi:diacylglycerol kinase (ATP)
VVGGDGSVHEAVNGMLQSSNFARLGVVPAGTGNDFAKACGIPLDWQRAAHELAARIRTGATPRRIDAGRLNGRYFANGAGVGFDAKVTRIARSCRWPIGDFVYLFAILRGMVDGIASPTLSITAGEFAWHGPVTLANVANGPWIGGMFHIVPGARNDDGCFDLLIADPVSRRRLLALLPKLVRGRHGSEPEITQASVTKLTIEASEPVPAHLDGEVLEPATHFEIEVLPGALELL